MCQVSMYVKRDDTEELVKENVTRLECDKQGIKVSTLFEGETIVDGAVLQHIDFSEGKILIHKP